MAKFKIFDGSNWIYPDADTVDGKHANNTANNIPVLDAGGKIQLANLPAGTTSAKGIVQLSDSVSSTSSTEAATAKAVKTAYDKANHAHPYAGSSHTHDDRYYTESEIDSKLNSKAPSTGSTSITRLGSQVTFGDGNAFTILQSGGTWHQKIETFDNSTSGDAVIRISQSSDTGSTWKTLAEVRDNGDIRGTYFNGFTIGKSVPSNAVFTDTWRGIQNSLTSTATDQSLSAYQGKVLNESKLPHSTISSGADANNLTTTGVYHIATTPSNCGTTNHGTLYVDFSIGTPYQIWWPDNQNTAYKRLYTGGAWGSWSQLKFTDTNTWRGVQDNLTSTAADQSLSANQGKVLKGLIDGKAATSHTHAYLPLAGGTVTGAITSSLSTSTHINGNKGSAIINSIASGDGYTMLAKMNSKNGAWTLGNWSDTFSLFYTAKATIDAGTNNYTKRLILLNESGNSSFPGTVTAPTFSGSLAGNATSATTATTASRLATARTISLAGAVTGSGSFDGSGNLSISTSISSHNHTSLTGITKLTFAADSSDSASISTTVSSSSTYFDFNLSDDATQNDQWRWRFSPSGGSTFNAMVLNPVSLTSADLTVTGTINATSSLKEGGVSLASKYAALSHTHNYAGSSSAGGAATSANKLATARTISLAGAVSGSASFDGSGNITINTTDQKPVTTITKTLTVGTGWIDTGIVGSNVATGSHVIQVLANNSGNGLYSEFFTGFMSWYASNTNSSETNEIVLHQAGHANNGKCIYLRTVRVGSSSSSTGYMKLQIAANATLASQDYVFKFRQLI